MRRLAVIALLLTACGDDAGEGGSGASSSTSESGEDTRGGGSGPATTAGGTTSTTTGGGVDETGTDSTGPGPAACPPSRGAWPSHSLDPSNSRYVADEPTLTAATVAGLTEQWAVGRLEGVTSTPVVRDGVVYIIDWSGDVHARCLSDGSERWRTKVAQAANATPLVTDDAVFVSDARGYLHRIARDTGGIEWTLELDPHPQANIYASPVLAGGQIVIGVASTELASMLDDYVFRGSVLAVDPVAGTETWRTYTTENDETAGAGVSVWSSAAVDEGRGLVFIGTGNTYEEPAAPLSDSVLALDTRTGEIVWHTQFTAGDVYTVLGPASSGPDADVGASPNLFSIDGQDVVGVGDKAGHYVVLDRDTGAQVWMQTLAPGSPLGGVMSTAAVGEGTIFVATNHWTELFAFGDPTNTATVFALSAATGAIQWQVEVAQPVFGALTLAADVLYHGDTAGRVYARDAATGAELWSTEPGGDIGGGMSIVDGTLLVGHGFWFFTQLGEPNGGLVAYGLD